MWKLPLQTKAEKMPILQMRKLGLRVPELPTLIDLICEKLRTGTKFSQVRPLSITLHGLKGLNLLVF